MRHFGWTHICLLSGLALTSVATNANADAWNKKTYVTISHSIEVPGAILAPGKYVFKLMDSASNRHIVQIMNAEENHVYTTNLAIAKERMEPADKTILTFYEMPGGGPEPVRAWFYPGDTIGQEFAYPSRRATEIAHAVGQPVPVLTASNTAPVETPAPEAQPTPAPVPDNSADRVVETPSEAAEPTPTPAPVTSEATSPESVEPPAEQPAETAAVQEPTQPAPTEPQMPHTAGNTAAMGLAGICLLGVAASIRKTVQRAGSRS